MQPADIWTRTLFPSFTDYVIMAVYLMVMFIWAFHIQRQKRDTQPAYQYYAWGLFAKVGGAMALGLIYNLYYAGGDTTGYFRSSLAMINLLMEDPGAYFRIMLGSLSTENLSAFTHFTGYPGYRHDLSSFNVVRYTSIFSLLGFQNYFTTSILFAWFFYTGYWKLYKLFVHLYPRYYKPFAFAILFFPSVLFWGSGILKDTIALSMTGWFLYSVYHAFVLKKKVFLNLLSTLFTLWIILSIKAYIIVALLPGVFIWLGWNYIKRFENAAIRFISAPLITVLFLGLGLGLLSLFGEVLGEYGSMEGILQKAIITYEDHTRYTQYGEGFYDLGTFDGTLTNFFSKAPAAITAGLFRPFLWEVRNPVMLLAALENTAFFLMMLVIIWRTGPIKTVKIAFDEPLVIFSLSFALVFAFAVGVATANFGALMRLKTPLIPFLVGALFILYYRSKEIGSDST
ncbi:MAG: hypothetical protein ACK4VN_07475 [Bacteroidales bacterium]